MTVHHLERRRRSEGVCPWADAVAEDGVRENVRDNRWRRKLKWKSNYLFVAIKLMD